MRLRIVGGLGGYREEGQAGPGHESPQCASPASGRAPAMEAMVPLRRLSWDCCHRETKLSRNAVEPAPGQIWRARREIQAARYFGVQLSKALGRKKPVPSLKASHAPTLLHILACALLPAPLPRIVSSSASTHTPSSEFQSYIILNSHPRFGSKPDPHTPGPTRPHPGPLQLLRTLRAALNARPCRHTAAPCSHQERKEPLRAAVRPSGEPVLPAWGQRCNCAPCGQRCWASSRGTRHPTPPSPWGPYTSLP